MADVGIICEGQTEQEFCKALLAPWLRQYDVDLFATLIGRTRKRGGIRPWQAYRSELLQLAKQRHGRHVGLLVDYYGLPVDWPGRSTAPGQPPIQRGKHVENALRHDLRDQLGDRFVPCVQMHEFESLLFACPEHTAKVLTSQPRSTISAENLQVKLQEVLNACGDRPDLINDTPQGAPSKRIKSFVPSYDKVFLGVESTKTAGLKNLRYSCSWLNDWLEKLEKLAVQ